LVAPSPPTTEELNRDVETLVKSAKTLLRLLATSSAFRIIVADLLQAIRETVDEFAFDVERIALQAQIGAEEVRDASRFDDATLETLAGKVKEVAKEVMEVGETTAERWATVDPTQKTKDTVIGRVQEVGLIYHSYAQLSVSTGHSPCES
jgi:archaellum component FlaC